MAAVLRRTGKPGGWWLRGSASMSSDMSGASWLTAQPRRDSSIGMSRPTAGSSDPQAATTRRNRPSSTTSVTAPLSASSSSAADWATSFDQAVQVGTGEQGTGQVAEPLQLAVPPVRLLQRLSKRVLLSLRQLPHVTEGHQGHQGRHRGEQQADGVVLADQPEAEPDR